MRFVNSGTEATMDAIRVARAATGPGQDHEDGGLVPRAPRLGPVLRGPRGRRARHAPQRRPAEGQAWYTTQPTSKGIPRSLWDDRDRRAVQRRRRRWSRRSRDNPGEIARGDPRARDDEHRHRGAEARLPPGAARRVRQARRRADLRRGQVRRHDRLRRHDRALRREAAPRRVREGDRRRRDDRRVRRRGPRSWSG